VNIDLSLAPDEQKKIRDSVFNQLEAAGVVIDPNAELVLRMSVEKGKQGTISYRSLGGRFSGRNNKDVTYTPTISHVKLLAGKEVLWFQSERNNPGSIINTSENETANDVVKRQCQPRGEFFASILLPRFLTALPDGKESLGTSKVTVTGVE